MSSIYGGFTIKLDGNSPPQDSNLESTVTLKYLTHWLLKTFGTFLLLGVSSNGVCHN